MNTYFYQIWPNFGPEGSIDIKPIIDGPGNGMATSRRQAITVINDDLFAYYAPIC